MIDKKDLIKVEFKPNYIYLYNMKHIKLNEELLKIKKYITLLENYETTPEEMADPVRNSISYPKFEGVSEMFDETGMTTPYGEDSGVITPEFVKEESVEDVAKKHNIDLSKYKPDQIRMGMEVEKEHGSEGKYNVTHDDKFKTLEIVLDHLEEDPDYYTKLNKMEKGDIKEMGVNPNKRSNKPDLYHAMLSQALEKATEYAESKGYTVDADEMFNSFGTGGVSYGATKRGYLTLYKDGVPAKKKLAIQIYRMPSGTYELNRYINEKQLDTDSEHNEYENQMKLQKFFSFLEEKDSEIQLFKRILYETGLYLKLIKLKSGKQLSNKDEILGDVRDLLTKLEMPTNEQLKNQMLELVNSLITQSVSEEVPSGSTSPTCACDEMNEKVFRIKSIKVIK